MGASLPMVAVTTVQHGAFPSAVVEGPVSCKVVAADDESRWDAFVASQPEASGYHLWRWRRVFEQGLGHRSHYLIAERRGLVAGILPLVEVRSRLFGRALSSLPYVNYGGVLAADAAAGAALVDRAAAIARERSLSFVVLRHRHRLFAGLPARSHKVTMLLPLAPTADAMWDQLDRKVRNQVRKAEKSGVVVESGGLELLDDFYRVFARNMRDLGTPVYGRDLFAAILREFPVEARLQIGRLNGAPIAVALSYAYGDWMEVPSASSLREHRALCANHLIYWNVISSAIAGGTRMFDFGRSTPNDGTYHFKEQWGAAPQPLWWEYVLGADERLPADDRHSPKYRMTIDLWKRLPLSVATAVGPHIARLIP
ncbi:MAG: FemAB family PEP-CTERM system-associated protein [Luteitalea sp.]|nr:FemAB family PEP-CTERM system-associated protein [Luteitalea sp.]